MKQDVPSSQHAANLIGALSLGLADRIVAETEALIGAGANASAALILIGTGWDMSFRISESVSAAERAAAFKVVAICSIPEEVMEFSFASNAGSLFHR